MKRKGFTLVELLAVIVILAIILAIAIPSITNVINNAQASAYEKNEKMLSKAARNYLAVNNSLIPNSTIYGNVVKLSDLVTNSYISGIKDVKDKSTTCTGYVVIQYNSDTSIEYNPYIKCGSNYTTDKYDDNVYNASKVFLVETLVVAGGGGGGGSVGYTGGGGAGGLLYQLTVPVIATNYSIVVGAGGASAISGSNSFALGLTAIGGGKGGCGVAGSVGGSGGGGGHSSNAGGAGTSGQGNRGGTGYNSSSASAGGGGGAGGVGADGVVNANGAAGGVGLQYNISGTAKYYAGGGGGGVEGATYTGGIGGLGGGGNGGSHYGTAIGGNGTANTGGGGGGGNPGGTGGSGIVIIRYLGSAKATGGTITSVGGYTIHTFTTTGTSTFTVSSF